MGNGIGGRRMRPIKFRAWDKRRNRMIEVTSINFRDGTIQEDTRLAVNRKVYLDDVVLMQATGLTDKNGVEIYDGDIVKERFSSINYDAEYERHMPVIRENTGAWRIKYPNETLGNVISVRKRIEVIGNIYEHPHLLEGADQ